MYFLIPDSDPVVDTGDIGDAGAEGEVDPELLVLHFGAEVPPEVNEEIEIADLPDFGDILDDFELREDDFLDIGNIADAEDPLVDAELVVDEFDPSSDDELDDFWLREPPVEFNLDYFNVSDVEEEREE